MNAHLLLIDEKRGRYEAVISVVNPR